MDPIEVGDQTVWVFVLQDKQDNYEELAIRMKLSNRLETNQTKTILLPKTILFILGLNSCSQGELALVQGEQNLKFFWK